MYQASSSATLGALSWPSGICLCYWAGFMTRAPAVVFALGIFLAFYVPGFLVTRYVWDGHSGVGPLERTGVVVVVSILVIGLLALALDATPFGITQISLAASITFLVVGEAAFRIGAATYRAVRAR